MIDDTHAIIPARQVETLGPADDDQVTISRAQLQMFMQMFANATVGAAPRALGEAERAHHYRAAFADWLSNNPKTGQPRPAATIAAYTAAWTDFRLCCPRDPWRITPADIKSWIADMRGRSIDPAVARGLITAGRRQDHIGFSDGTQAQYLAAVSSFFTYCANYPVELADGSSVPLFDGVNPVKAQGVPKPAPRPFAEANYLNPEQLKTLLETIARWARSDPARNLQGLRDYALFTCYVITGGRSSEIRVWRWSDLRQQAGRTFYHWDNKGKSGWDELPPPAWDAVRTYLQLANRLGTIQPGDYIFTALSDCAERFRRHSRQNHQPPAPGRQPLSGHEVGRLLKKYGKLAGFDERLLHVHTLRHSAYMLYTEGGVDVRFCSKMLHHGSLATTSHYDHVMAGQRNTEWAKAWSLIDLAPLTFEADDQHSTDGPSCTPGGSR